MNQQIADYFKTQPVVRAWLFGSFARGEETPLSDVDLLVQYDEDGISLLKHAAMICELEKILDRPVDIVEEGTLRPRVRESVNQDRKLILRENVRDRDRLEHIVEAITYILDFADGKTKLPATSLTPIGMSGRKAKWSSKRAQPTKLSFRLLSG